MANAEPARIRSLKDLQAIKEKVAFVPGAPFYVRPEIKTTLRLSFSCVDEATIEEGVKRLTRALARML